MGRMVGCDECGGYILICNLEGQQAERQGHSITVPVASPCLAEEKLKKRSDSVFPACTGVAAANFE